MSDFLDLLVKTGLLTERESFEKMIAEKFEIEIKEKTKLTKE